MLKKWIETSGRLWALFPLRLAIGYGFLAHGLAKWDRGPANFAKLLQQIDAPFPTATAWMVTFLEVFGGLAILAGVLVAIVSIPLICSMLVAMFTVQIRYGFSSVNTIGLTPSGPLFGPPGYEINLLYIAGLLALILAGPSALSVDRWLASKGSSKAENTATIAVSGKPAQRTTKMG
jgi:putative oxidoreductase